MMIEMEVARYTRNRPESPAWKDSFLKYVSAGVKHDWAALDCVGYSMFTLAGCLTMVAGCSTKESVNAQRQRLIHLLEGEARSNTGWARIHAGR